MPTNYLFEFFSWAPQAIPQQGLGAGMKDQQPDRRRDDQGARQGRVHRIAERDAHTRKSPGVSSPVLDAN